MDFILEWSRKYAELFVVIVSIVFLEISSAFNWDSNPVMGADKFWADLLIVFVCILVIRSFGLLETAGFRWKGLGTGLLYGMPFLILGIGSVIISNVGVDLANLTFISMPHAILFTVNMLLVGMNEEIWMRALVLNALMRKYGIEKHGIMKAIVVSAVVFGAIHIPNLFFMNPVNVIVQVVNAAAAGVLFGAIFIKSNNIWAGIIVHAMVDWCSLFVANCFKGAESVLSMNMSLGQACIVILLGALPPVLIAYLYLKKL